MDAGESSNFVQADGLSLTLFCLFAVLMAGIIWKATSKVSSSQKWRIWVFVLTLLASAGAISGITATNVIPILPLFFATILGTAVFFAFSESGNQVGAAFSTAWLVGFQGFRLPLELILHQWAKVGTIPETMTWTGSNIDIVAGIIALSCAPFANKSTKLAWFSQVTGLLLLINVIRVVVMSSPFPFSWDLETPLLLGAYFPYVLIAPLFVMPALAGHLITIRKLLRN